MSALPDWTIWALAAAVTALLLIYFLAVGRAILTTARWLIEMIQNWPQIRRAMVEAEVQSSGGRYPLWFRAARVFVVLAIIVLTGIMLWRLFG